MNTSDTQDVKVVYRRWILIIPALLIIIGFTLLFGIGSSNATVGLIGGILAFIGILTFGVLLSSAIGIEAAARMLSQKSLPQSSIREKIEANDHMNGEKENNGS